MTERQRDIGREAETERQTRSLRKFKMFNLKIIVV